MNYSHYVYIVISAIIIITVNTLCGYSQQNMLNHYNKFQEMEFIDENLSHEISRIIKSDSVKNIVRDKFFPGVDLQRYKYLKVSISNYTVHNNAECNLVEELNRDFIKPDSTFISVALILSNNCIAEYFSIINNDTIYILDFPYNLNDKFLRKKDRFFYKQILSKDSKLETPVILDFLYIDEKLYLNPNKYDWGMNYH